MLVSFPGTAGAGVVCFSYSLDAHVMRLTQPTKVRAFCSAKHSTNGDISDRMWCYRNETIILTVINTGNLTFLGSFAFRLLTGDVTDRAMLK